MISRKQLHGNKRLPVYAQGDSFKDNVFLMGHPWPIFRLFSVFINKTILQLIQKKFVRPTEPMSKTCFGVV